MQGRLSGYLPSEVLGASFDREGAQEEEINKSENRNQPFRGQEG